MKKAMAMILSLVLLCACGAWAEGDAPSLEELAGLEWSFSSGAGAWSTDLRLSADGTFAGEYHDSEMSEAAEEYPNGTVYCCAFTGRMSLLEPADDGAWAVRVDSLALEKAPGEESVDEGIRFVTTEPYGIREGDELRLFRPGTPVDALAEDMRVWAHVLGEEAPETLETWFMYSEQSDSGFVGIPAATLANPWADLTREQLEQASGVSFGVPEGAEDVVYRWLESESLAEMQFTLDGDGFCARIQPAALEEGELMNISGMYFAWENEERVTVGHCSGSLGQARTGSEDWVELCLWYDAAPGLMYSLSVCSTDLDGLDLTAVAERVYVPMQGDA